ncbi:aspartyl/asparaginyl beta-hydroxylase domain-containing protein [Candidatus Cyanaurora vandensis]|uniref:aspartyl/asparaginyl beta-hydroxylase domain-containing protein n=1 Tax=Candidatus Cyanaurora vandensis TaxID=2714958 RepID=UPI00257F3C15|nr:aspartyl/asparaginyl beta-hydroxylase domain-containing protein [Candidatus Cyanaurora vandensis]
MFFESSEFEFAQHLEANWLTIKAELEQVANVEGGGFQPWPDKKLYDSGTWGVLPFYAFGSRVNANCELCPETTKLVEAIPDMSTASFSALEPGTHIRAHVGYSDEVLRCHLGLVVPEGCVIRVAEEIRPWQEGKCLIFDDTFEHEVWNRSDKTRVVLLIDFKKPPGREYPKNEKLDKFSPAVLNLLQQIPK